LTCAPDRAQAANYAIGTRSMCIATILKTRGRCRSVGPLFPGAVVSFRGATYDSGNGILPRICVARRVHGAGQGDDTCRRRPAKRAFGVWVGAGRRRAHASAHHAQRWRAAGKVRLTLHLPSRHLPGSEVTTSIERFAFCSLLNGGGAKGGSNYG
jgi:hypothetical protein